MLAVFPTAFTTLSVNDLNVWVWTYSQCIYPTAQDKIFVMRSPLVSPNTSDRVSLCAAGGGRLIKLMMTVRSHVQQRFITSSSV